MKKDNVQIASRDFWFKIVEFLQQNWALIDKLEGESVKVFFIHDASGVFDEINFDSEQVAQSSLIRNGFRRYSEDLKAQDFIRPPQSPFFRAIHPNGPIYSSGRYWK